MRKLSGAVLILTAEQAFAHAHIITYPNQPFAKEALVPASLVLGVLGAALLVWGVFQDAPSASS